MGIYFSKFPFIRGGELESILYHASFLTLSLCLTPRTIEIKLKKSCRLMINETSTVLGQRVGKIFHDADIIISTDAQSSIADQVNRFCELLFGSNRISPTRFEYGMFLAKAAALRSLDLSRQVGAAIFSHSGEVISLGSNEVPKAGGGSYWCDEKHDDRDYMRGFDSNEQRRKENLSEFIKKNWKV